eukprot:1155359-Pelagomonas_calceolata.AAC.1
MRNEYNEREGGINEYAALAQASVAQEKGPITEQGLLPFFDSKALMRQHTAWPSAAPHGN